MNRIPLHKSNRAPLRAHHGRACPVCGRPVMAIGHFGPETTFLHKLELTMIGGMVTYREITNACIVRTSETTTS